MAELTQKQLQYRRDLLAKIHLCEQYGFMRDNDCWSEFLTAHFGVESCAKLGIGELKTLLDYLYAANGDRALLYNRRDPRGGETLADLENRYYTCPNSDRFAEPDDPTIALKATDKQIDAIVALWDKLNRLSPQEDDLEDFMQSKIHRVRKLDRLNKTEAQKIIGVLRKLIAHYDKKAKEQEQAEAESKAKTSRYIDYSPANNPSFNPRRPLARS